MKAAKRSDPFKKVESHQPDNLEKLPIWSTSIFTICTYLSLPQGQCHVLQKTYLINNYPGKTSIYLKPQSKKEKKLYEYFSKKNPLSLFYRITKACKMNYKPGLYDREIYLNLFFPCQQLKCVHHVAVQVTGSPSSKQLPHRYSNSYKWADYMYLHFF